jgi:hypothetical protein
MHLKIYHLPRRILQDQDYTETHKEHANEEQLEPEIEWSHRGCFLRNVSANV